MAIKDSGPTCDPAQVFLLAPKGNVVVALLHIGFTLRLIVSQISSGDHENQNFVLEHVNEFAAN